MIKNQYLRILRPAQETKRERNTNTKDSIKYFSVGLAVECTSCFISVLRLDLCVCCFGALINRSPSS